VQLFQEGVGEQALEPAARIAEHLTGVVESYLGFLKRRPLRLVVVTAHGFASLVCCGRAWGAWRPLAR